MLNHTSLQLSDVLPKKHLNLQHQLWPIDQWTMQWSEQRWRHGNVGFYLILVDTERWRRGVHLLHRAEALRALKKSILMLFQTFCPSLLSTAKLKYRKSCRLWWGGFWYFSCFGLEVRQSSDACVDRCVFIQEQICLRTATNMFHINWQIYLAWSHKYISFLWQIYFKIKPANLFVWSDKYFHKM